MLRHQYEQYANGRLKKWKDSEHQYPLSTYINSLHTRRVVYGSGIKSITGCGRDFLFYKNTQCHVSVAMYICRLYVHIHGEPSVAAELCAVSKENERESDRERERERAPLDGLHCRCSIAFAKERRDALVLSSPQSPPLCR